MNHEREPARVYSIRATIHDVPYSTTSAGVCVYVCADVAHDAVVAGLESHQPSECIIIIVNE